MEIKLQITKQINKMTKIKLIKEDLIKRGLLSDAYRYKIQNIKLIVKCFKERDKAKQEDTAY